MICSTSQVSFEPILPDSFDRNDLLFFDIETTGLSAKNSMVYLIGYVFCQNDNWQLTQLFCDDPADERKMLLLFTTILSQYKFLLHYNGDSFDIPFLKEKCRQLSIEYVFETITSIDLYKKVRPLKHLFGLSELKQPAVEAFFHLQRDDKKTGLELISVYRHYVLFPSKKEYNELMLHNLDDLKGLLGISAIMNYAALFSGSFTIQSLELHSFGTDEYAQHKLVVQLAFPYRLSQNICCQFQNYSCTITQNSCSISIPVVQDELYYFYKDYKNYYYLPVEDTAIHKSVGQYMDPSFRQKASASNCYSKKAGFFLLQVKDIAKPVFQRCYKGKEKYIECAEEFLQDFSSLEKYILSILELLLKKGWSFL